MLSINNNNFQITVYCIVTIKSFIFCLIVKRSYVFRRTLLKKIENNQKKLLQICTLVVYFVINQTILTFGNNLIY